MVKIIADEVHLVARTCAALHGRASRDRFELSAQACRKAGFLTWLWHARMIELDIIGNARSQTVTLATTRAHAKRSNMESDLSV